MADYVTAAELESALGVGTLYDEALVESIAQASTDLVNKYLWFNSFPVVAATIVDNVATLVISAPLSFSIGQHVTISGVGNHYDGERVVTAVWPYTGGQSVTSFPWFNFYPFGQWTWPRGYSMIQFSSVASNDVYHQILPYGKALGPDTKATPYSEEALVRLAALEIAVDMWQSRQSSSANGLSPDGGISPYRMGFSLTRRVYGLLTPFMGPRSWVG